MKLTFKRILAVFIACVLLAVVVYGVGWKIERKERLHVVINEFYPWKKGDPRPGWVELYNPTDEIINVTYWGFWYSGFFGPLNPWMFGFYCIYPHEYVLLGNKTLIRRYWDVPDNVRIVEMPPIAEPPEGYSITFCSSLRIEAVTSLEEPGKTVDEVPSQRPLISEGHSWARYRGEYGVDNLTRNFYDEPEPTPGYENHRVKNAGWQDNMPYLLIEITLAGIIAVTAVTAYLWKKIGNMGQRQREERR